MKNYGEIYKDYVGELSFSGSLGGLIQRAINIEGKHLRPALVLAWCDYCGGDVSKALPAALAVELVHTASLIQDDLPCMDDTRTRRGKPAMHVYAGEGGAILCSDSLLAIGYSLLTSIDVDSDTRLEMVRLFSETFLLMCDGQFKELISNGLDQIDWADIHLKKTGALMSCACKLGAIIADVPTEEAENFGLHFGLAFQLLDDLRDRDGALTIWSEKEIAQALSMCLSNLKLNKTNEAADFLNSLVDKLL
jgi:geranylgeranyl diphosphate synthase type II